MMAVNPSLPVRTVKDLIALARKRPRRAELRLRRQRFRGIVVAIGVATSRRIAAFPDLPAMAEAGVPGYEATQWYGVLVSAGTPPENSLAGLASEPDATQA